MQIALEKMEVEGSVAAIDPYCGVQTLKRRILEYLRTPLAQCVPNAIRCKEKNTDPIIELQASRTTSDDKCNKLKCKLISCF